MGTQRIDKILSTQEIASRSEIKSMIRHGRISVNGVIIKRPEEKFDPDNAEIAVDGELLNFRRFLYIMMNKPQGVLSASNDRSAKTVIDLLPPELYRKDLFPAGRLDKNTEGFVLITNDGELSHRMLSPKSHVYKLYEAVLDRKLTDRDVLSFRQGISWKDISFMSAEMKIIDENRALVEICEGKFHQIKRMFSAIGAEVTYLKRLRIGGVFLDEKLGAGECRELTDQEKIDILNLKHGL